MNESPDDLQWLQELLDASYAASGSHLGSIHTPKVRLTAEEVVERFHGMRVAVVATTSSDGRPLTGPVDAFLHRARVHFGTDPASLRARHVRRRPAISATWVDAEATVVTVHGRARRLELDGRDRAFAAVCREQYGAGWDQWGAADGWYACIEPHRMFAADMSRHLS